VAIVIKGGATPIYIFAVTYHYWLIEMLLSKSRAWCKTIVTTSLYIRSYNSLTLAISPRSSVKEKKKCQKGGNFAKGGNLLPTKLKVVLKAID